jgi:hypothetical protein
MEKTIILVFRIVEKKFSDKRKTIEVKIFLHTKGMIRY